MNKKQSNILPLSIVIPTYQREKVLIDTVNYLLNLPYKAQEIILVDQTQSHTDEVDKQLKQWHTEQKIKWIRLSKPSICHAMNRGMLEAKCDLVVYLDDDIIPKSELLQAYWKAHQIYPDTIIAGRVIQPWEENKVIEQLVPGNGTCATVKPGWIDFFMGGNFAISRCQFMQLGGFDENFIRVAYQFEAEFAHRYLQLTQKKIYFEPLACIHHLKVSAGGTRSYGEHLTTWKSYHTVGAYYYLLKSFNITQNFPKICYRLVRSVITRHHLKKPWWIPATIVSEMGGLIWACYLILKGPQYPTFDTSDHKKLI